MAKQQQQREQVPDARTYTEQELKDFDVKIQRFYEPRVHSKTGEIHSILNYDKLGVAFGALVEIVGSKNKVAYAIPNTTKLEGGEISGHERYVQLWNLVEQWKFWKRGLDWKKEKAATYQEKAYEQMALETGVQDRDF